MATARPPHRVSNTNLAGFTVAGTATNGSSARARHASAYLSSVAASPSSGSRRNPSRSTAASSVQGASSGPAAVMTLTLASVGMPDDTRCTGSSPNTVCPRSTVSPRATVGSAEPRSVSASVWTVGRPPSMPAHSTVASSDTTSSPHTPPTRAMRSYRVLSRHRRPSRPPDTSGMDCRMRPKRRMCSTTVPSGSVVVAQGASPCSGLVSPRCLTMSLSPSCLKSCPAASVTDAPPDGLSVSRRMSEMRRSDLVMR